MGRPRCVRATCDLRLRTANSIKPAESEILWRETPSCSMDGAGARRTRTEVAYLTGSESEQSKGAPRS